MTTRSFQSLADCNSSEAPTQMPTQLAPTGPKNRGLRRRRSIETQEKSLISSAPGAKGRTFESCRAHHVFNNLQPFYFFSPAQLKTNGQSSCQEIELVLIQGVRLVCEIELQCYGTPTHAVFHEKGLNPIAHIALLASDRSAASLPAERRTCWILH
jgi:hypothetical protein